MDYGIFITNVNIEMIILIVLVAFNASQWVVYGWVVILYWCACKMAAWIKDFSDIHVGVYGRLYIERLL